MKTLHVKNLRQVVSLTPWLIVVAFVMTACGSSSANAVKPTPTPSAHQRYVAAVEKRQSQLRSYAAALLPHLRRSLPSFQCPIQYAASHSAGDIQTYCAGVGQDITLAQADADGVPHPYNWYSAVGTLHHQVMGIYHDMVGAVVNWQTASDNGDPGSQSQAVSDMTQARDSMNAMIARVASTARRG